MYVDTARSVQLGKTYTRHLLRESYREGGKVKHRTIANLSHCSAEEIEAIKLALRHKKDLAALGSIAEVELDQGVRVGAVACALAIARRLGIAQALGTDRQGKLALWQVLARLIDQGSRLSSVRLAAAHASVELLGLRRGFNEDDLYDNLAWLSDHQERIETRLFRKRYGSSAAPSLFLYDVTSSYCEGVCNELAAYGYNRDGKKNKKQIVIGLLCGPDGAPVAVRVFTGNTTDTKTVAEQVRMLTESLGVTDVTLVGDRGMLKGPQIDALPDGFRYITAITKPQIRLLLASGVIQYSLFDERVCEVEHDGVRYILRRNPVRTQELARCHAEKLAALMELAAERTAYLAGHPRAKVDKAVAVVRARAEKLKIDGWVAVVAEGRTICVTVDDEARQRAALLDGCYVIKTDLPVAVADAQTVHDRYTDLEQVERAFRTIKTAHLQLRPFHVRTEKSTRGHVFVVMLAYLLQRELEAAWSDLDVTVTEGLDELGSLRAVEMRLHGVSYQRIPQPTGLGAQLLAAIDVPLPEVLPARTVRVATRKKLPERRKKHV